MNEELSVLTKSDILVEHPKFIQDAMGEKQKTSGVYIAGGTLIQLNWEAGQPFPIKLINLESIQELKGIEYVNKEDRSFIKIGALTTISECIKHPIVLKYTPLLVEACKKIAAPAVRNRATIGGNVASGIGDAIPALLSLDAELTIRTQDITQKINLSDWLQMQKQSSQAPFLLIDLVIPCQMKDDQFFFKKVGRREAFTPALVTISVQWKRNRAELLDYIRIAVGGGSHHPMRLEKVEKIVEANFYDENVVKSIYLNIFDEFISYSDPFITEAYRKQVVANILVAELMNIFSEREDGSL